MRTSALWLGVFGPLTYIKGALELCDFHFQRRQLLPCAGQYRRLHVELVAGNQIHVRQRCRHGGTQIVLQILVYLAESARQAFGNSSDQRVEGLWVEHVLYRLNGTTGVPVPVI